MLAGVTVLCVLLLFSVFLYQKEEFSGINAPSDGSDGAEYDSAKESQTAKPQDTREPAEIEPAEEKENTDYIYTYLQGPKSWKRGIDWSGEWGDSYMDGGYFGGFGCGLCCVANIYSTLTDYQCSPVDAYRYAKKHTGYCGGTAIAWGYMRRTLTSQGFDCHVANKPVSYEEFETDVSNSLCSIVLVSSSASKVYWKDTPGHYVTIFAYDAQKQKIFLADSGDPNHNRQWVSLKKIYKSLKMESSWQYLVVERYQKKKDSWRHKKTTGTWNPPAYL